MRDLISFGYRFQPMTNKRTRAYAVLCLFLSYVVLQVLGMMGVSLKTVSATELLHCIFENTGWLINRCDWWVKKVARNFAKSRQGSRR